MKIMYNFDFLEQYVNNNEPYNKEDLDEKLNGIQSTYIFGAGSSGITALKWLTKSYSIEIKGFIDNDLDKKGKIIDGYTVFCKDDIAKEAMILITSTFYEEIYNQLNSLGYKNLFILPIDLLIWDEFQTIEWLSNEEKLSLLKSSYEILDDAMSKDILIRVLLYRWTLDKKFLKQSPYIQYCSPEIFKEDIKSIVDAGAFDGDTIKVFKKFFTNCKKIYAFEPTKNNYEKICSMSIQEQTLDIIAVNKGVWNKPDTLSFIQTDSTGGNNKISTNLNDTQLNTIDVIDLDTYFKYSNEQIDLIKMDIEGAEVNGLYGMRNLIIANKPVLEVCIYHNIEHFVEVIKFIKELNLEYKFYLGHHSNWMLETVLYAIPQK